MRIPRSRVGLGLQTPLYGATIAKREPLLKNRLITSSRHNGLITIVAWSLEVLRVDDKAFNHVLTIKEM